MASWFTGKSPLLRLDILARISAQRTIGAQVRLATGGLIICPGWHS
jgi:hypothetical protein